jgi:hypothetical protein
MAGILGNDGSLTSKAQELAKSVVGEASQEEGSIPSAQILLHDMKLRGVNPKAGLVGMVTAQKQGAIKLWRKNNTIMAVQKLSPIAAKVHFFTMDPEPVFQSLVKANLESLKKSGCQAIYDVVVDPHIVRALQAAGAQVRPSDNPQFKLEAVI